MPSSVSYTHLRAHETDSYLVCRLLLEKKKSGKKTKKHRTQNTPRNPQQVTTSRRRAKKHVPRVSPCSPASIDTGFVEIGLVQLSQSVKTTNSMSHTHTHIPTDKLNDGTLYTPRYEEAFGLKAKNGLGRFAPSALPQYNTKLGLSVSSLPFYMLGPVKTEKSKP